MAMDRPSYAVTVRLPMRTEYWQTESLPEPGTTVSYCGHDYLVVSCEHVRGGGYVARFAETESAESRDVDLAPA
jgi:hypothetical protein